jgi:hypothetical protein
MKEIVTIILLLSFSYSFSQNTQDNRTTSRNNSNGPVYYASSINGQKGVGDFRIGGVGMWVQKANVINEVAGTIYLYDSWFNNMTLFTNDKKSYELNNSNFDLLRNEFVVKVSIDSIFTFDKNSIKYATLNNVVYKKFNYENKDTFLAVLINGKKTSFLRKDYVSILEGSFNQMTQRKITKDKYVIKTNYFSFSKGKINNFKLKKGDVLSLFKDQKSKVKNFVKKNKLSYRQEEDVMKLFEFYNEL